MKASVYLVEDDHNFGSVLKAYLTMNGYAVEWAQDGQSAMDQFTPGGFDLCIIDVMLPKVDGFSVANFIREQDSEVPFIFLTAKKLKQDILKGYKAGADDYITKPFDSEVLLYKIAAILKRKNRNTIEENGEITIGAYRFNHKLRVLYFEDQLTKLSPKEAALLKLLCNKINDVLLREEALNAIWGEDNYFTTRSMDVYITKLRKYLSNDPHITITNIHSSGYRLAVEGG